MTIRAIPLLGLGVALTSGCTGPLDRAWDDPLFRDLAHRHHDADLRLAEDHGAERAEGTKPLLGSEGLTVDDAVRLAIQSHPSLRGAGYRVDAAGGRAKQAGLYPNPSVVYGAEGLGADAAGGGEQTLKIEQEIVLGGRLRNARGVAESDRLAAEAEFRAEEFGVASRVSRAYFAAAGAQRRLEARRELNAVADRLAEAVSARVEAGAATLPDRLRAEVVVEQSRMVLEAAELEALATRRTLATMIGLDADAEFQLASPMTAVPDLPGYDDVLTRALASNSAVGIARLGVERARRAHSLAKSESAPDLAASIGPRYSDADGETTLDLGLGLEIPLFDRNQGAIRAALSDRLAAAARLRAVELQLISDAARAWADFESARVAVRRYEASLLPKSEQTLRLTQESYELGKTEFLRLLDAQQVVVESRVSYFEALERLHLAAATLRELMMDESPWRTERDVLSPDEEVTP